MSQSQLQEAEKQNRGLRLELEKMKGELKARSLEGEVPLEPVLGTKMNRIDQVTPKFVLFSGSTDRFQAPGTPNSLPLLPKLERKSGLLPNDNGEKVGGRYFCTCAH